MSDDDFLAAFEDARLAALPHRDHLRLAWLYLRRDGAIAGTERVREGIQRFAAAKGAPGRYHETLTVFWIRLVARAAADGAPTFDELLRRHPELLCKDAPLLFYRAETLAGAAARTRWLEPDLAAPS